MSGESKSGKAPAPSSVQRGSGADSSQEQMIGSLGEALAGVSLGNQNARHNNGFLFHNEHEARAPFNLATQTSGGGDYGWGFNASDSARSSFPPNGGNAGGEETGGGNVGGNGGGGSNGNNNKNNGAGGGVSQEPVTPQRAQRKKSIDLFLSQSPSQMLGNDVFKLSTGNLPGLAMPEQENSQEVSGTFGSFRQTIGQVHAPISASPGNIGEIRQNQEVRRKTESPSSAVTGTTTSSRSDSPYTNVDAGRTIQAYHGYDNSNLVAETLNKRQPSYAEDDRPPGYPVNQNHNPHTPMTSLEAANSQRLQSPYSANSVGGNGTTGQNFANFGSPYDQGNDRGSPQARQPNMPANPQQQVLYMAVPTPDGRGQVLQPVQMVQLPGKPFAYVVPGSGGMPSMQGGMADGQQPMMVMPSMPVAQQGQSNDLVSGLVAGGGRNSNQNKGMGGYMTNDNGAQQYGDNTMSGLRDEYNSIGQGNMAGNNQYMPPVNQPDSISSLYSTPQRPPLDALLGQVRRLSRDQVGCRLVQQALDEEGPMAATLILNEGLPFWGEAMVDPFGNYLFQKILEKITAKERVMLVKSVSTRLVNASLNLHGTRSVQKIVELCSADEEKGEAKENEETAADILTRALAPAAARLCIDSHGNHVIQRILLKLGHKHSKFVFDAVAESVGDVARHRHGCCVIQRCLDSPPSPARSHLVHRIVDKALELMQDAYGNYVVQYVLDVCSDEDVHAVCESVIGKVNLLAIQKFSSNVMEKCLERCTDRVKEAYMQELSDPERVRELMMDPFGNYVVQRALSVATHAQAVRLVEAMRPHLLASQPGTPNGQRNGGVRNTAGGRRIMAKICRRFPNFTLTAVGTREELYSQNRGHHRHQHPNQQIGSPYGQLSPGPHLHQHYNGNPHAVNLGTHQFDQRQPYYDIGDTAYFQHTPHMGHGAYPSI